MQQDRSRREAELSSEEFPARIKENHLRTSPGSENVLLARHVCKDSKAKSAFSLFSNFPRKK